jgi:hypothetical protein
MLRSFLRKDVFVRKVFLGSCALFFLRKLITKSRLFRAEVEVLEVGAELISSLTVARHYLPSSQIFVAARYLSVTHPNQFY